MTPDRIARPLQLPRFKKGLRGTWVVEGWGVCPKVGDTIYVRTSARLARAVVVAAVLGSGRVGPWRIRPAAGVGP